MEGGGRGSTYGEGPREVARHGPAPASVQTEAFVGDDLEDSATPEGVRVRLALDLKNVEGE